MLKKLARAQTRHTFANLLDFKSLPYIVVLDSVKLPSCLLYFPELFFCWKSACSGKLVLLRLLIYIHPNIRLQRLEAEIADGENKTFRAL
jgi:hypothetical protein